MSGMKLHIKKDATYPGATIIIKVIMVLLLTTISCSEFLVQEPTDQISINEQFSTREGVLAAVNGMYKNIESLASGKVFFYADLQGGNFTFTPATSSKLIEVPPAISIDNVYNFRDIPEESDYEYFYQNAYGLVNEANLIMEQTADLDFLDETEKAQIRAEALVTRVYAHYLVTLLYAQNYNFTPGATHPGIVYNTRTLVAGVDYPSRKTMFETYEMIQSDLDEALSLFTANQALDYGPSYSYFNTVTTGALYARIALQMNDWEKAFTYSDEVISGSGITLMEGIDYIAEWDKTEEAVSEIILEFSAPRTSDDGTVSSSVAFEFFGYTNNTKYNEFVASGDLLDMYDVADIRRGMFLDILLPTSVNGIISDMHYYFTRKFQDEAGTTCIRLSEMYLIRAEARLRAGMDIEPAADDLNSIRMRAGLLPLTDTSNLLEEIFNERRRELAFEGHLLFDIARYKKDIFRNQGCLSLVCNLEYPSDYYILPIPNSSILLNENMVQNEGY